MRILENDGFDDWLEQRRGWVTATDLAKIKGGTAAQFHKLWLEKRTGSKFGGNKYTAWGKEREPVIAARVAAWVEADRNITLERNDCLCVVDDLGLAATPDMMEAGTDKPVAIGELKTWKGEWESWEAFFRAKPEYAVQVEAQLIVTGADVCVFAVETYREDSAGMIPGDIHYTYIEPDLIAQENIKELVRRFREYVPELDMTEDDFGLLAAADRIADIDSEKAALQAQIKELSDQKAALDSERAELASGFLEKYGEAPREIDAGSFVVTVKPGRKTSRFDRVGFKADYPELEQKYTVDNYGAATVAVSEV